MKNIYKLMSASILFAGIAGTNLFGEVVVSEKTPESVMIQINTNDNNDETIVIRRASDPEVKPAKDVKNVSALEYDFKTAKANNANIIFKGKKGQVMKIVNLKNETEYCFDTYVADKKTSTKKIKTLAFEPKNSAYALAFKNVSFDKMEALWQRGNGQGVIVAVSSDKNITKPIDGVEYTAGKFGDSKAKIGKSNTYIVFNSLQTSGEKKAIIEGLQEASKYTVQVIEFNGKGESINYLNDEVKGNPRIISTKLQTPIAKEATNITKNSFSANWQLGKNIKFYELDVAYDPEFTKFVEYFEKSDVGVIDNFDVDELKPGTYYYRLRALGEGCFSEYSNVIKVEIK